jgi:catechol 2,3-dioxygenase
MTDNVPDSGGAPLDPEELEALGTGPHAIPDETTVGPVHLSVAALDRSLEFYERSIGLRVLSRDDGRASLGAGERELLVLTEQPGARPADGFTGLYHFALLVPERRDLARWLAHAARERVALSGASDHFVSEAIYLNDPDRHGIEVYWDRPREAWEGQVSRMGTSPLDVDNLVGELADPASEPFDELPAGTIMGHVHLRVAEIDSTVGFYRDLLGFGLMAQLGPQAAFLSAGGYHHHLGGNVWESFQAAPAPAGTARLERWTVVLPREDDRSSLVERVSAAGHELGEWEGLPLVRDPSGNSIVLDVAASA